MRFAPALVASLFGLLIGLGGMTFTHAKGLSYMSTDPRACVNCHIMRPQYDAWQKSSHHGVATCADCHLPSEFPAKYIAKARNGWLHSKAFTLQNFPEPIRITPPNAAILQQQCEGCHADLVHEASAGSGAPACVHCHVDVGHGETLGLGGPIDHDSPTDPQ